jgi:type I restriction enzyme S subunit
MQSQTNGIRNLIMQEYLNQTVIVPPLQKQQEIVGHITAIQQQAKALQEEGKKILEQAKRDVERMIIGN